MWIKVTDGYVNGRDVLMATVRPPDGAVVFPLVAGRWAGPVGRRRERSAAAEVGRLAADWCDLGDGTYVNVDRFADAATNAAGAGDEPGAMLSLADASLSMAARCSRSRSPASGRGWSCGSSGGGANSRRTDWRPPPPTESFRPTSVSSPAPRASPEVGSPLPP